MDSKDKLSPVTIPNVVKFAFGGTAGMGATLLVHPLDLLKNRMQLSGLTGKKESRSTLHVLRSIIANEGFFTIYSGLSASLLRQATYTTSRLGIYTWLFELLTKDGATTSFATKAVIGSTAGAVGSFVGTPAEVTLIRMCADGRLPPEQRRRYKNVLDALLRVVREEGVFTLWRGCGPTVLRAMIVNATQLAIYSQSKEALLSTKLFKEGMTLQFAASMISGFATTVASMPIDIVKTRVQNMRMIGGKPEYNGMWDVWSKVMRNEGFFSLWKGFTPYYFRMGPHTMLTFIILEQLNAAYFKHILGMASKTAMVILAKGAEEMETVIPIDVLRRAGIEVTIAGLLDKNPVECSRKVIIVPDKALVEVADNKFDVVILPGGMQGANSLAASDEVGTILRTQYESGRYIAAICAAPIALKSHGIAPGILLTSHPCVKPKLVEGGYKYSEERVVIADHIVTSRGPGTALEFALKLVELLLGTEKVKEVVDPMIVKE